MTIAAAKARLHEYIDHADEQKVMEILSLFENDKDKSSYVYDEETLNMLRERSEAYLSGKSSIHTIQESMEHIKQHREKDGI